MVRASNDGGLTLTNYGATVVIFTAMHPMLFATTPTALCWLAAGLFATGVSAAPGDLYVTQEPYDPSPDRGIVKWTPQTTTGFAANLNTTGCIAFSRSGHLFVANAGTSEILEFTLDGMESTFASGVKGQGLAFDSSGNLFVAEPDHHEIIKIASDGTKTTFASGLNTPQQLAFDISGNLFATDSAAGQVLKFSPSGGKTVFASGLDEPFSLTFDPDSNLLVGQNSTVWKFAPDGTKTAYITGLYNPDSMAFDDSGALFVTSLGSITKFPRNGQPTSYNFFSKYLALAFEPVVEKVRNISARGFVGTGDSVLISGFILGGNALANNSIVLRAIGPSPAQLGVRNPLADPILELRNSEGMLIATNDNWQDTQEARIRTEGLAPRDPHESAIFATLPAGNFTAVVRGAGGSTGIALVEVYSR